MLLCAARAARVRGLGVLAVSLLVREPVSSVEQLLSRQPVVGDVTGLPADQIVRHDVQVPLISASVFNKQ